jgi:cyclic pyranopterin phosphate synthase
LTDTLRRPLRDLRISVTDRCNFRCSYCMPKEVFDKDYAYLPQSALLSFEEITRIARQFAAHGVQKIRLTGGEPLLQVDTALLDALHAQGFTIAVETNGSLPAPQPQDDGLAVRGAVPLLAGGGDAGGDGQHPLRRENCGTP